MTFQQIYQFALVELRREYDVSDQLINDIISDSELTEKCEFIYKQLQIKQQKLLDAYKQNLKYTITEVDVNADKMCGFITDYYNNGYRTFCDLPETAHDELLEKQANKKCFMHQYQKKNLNNVIDAKYQEGILTILNFISELTVFLMSQLISELLINCSTQHQVAYESDSDLRKFDYLMKTDPSYYRLNYLKNNQVIYYHFPKILTQESNL